MRLRITPLRVLVTLVAAVAVTFLILVNIKSGYYLFVPDVAHPVAPLVRVQGATPARGGGQLYFVDVHEVEASEFDMLFRDWLYPHSSKIKTSDLFPPGTSSDEYIKGTYRQMATSQKYAAAVAEMAVGLHVVAHYNGVLVDNVYGNVPAAAQIDPSDVIVAANGKPTITLDALYAVMAKVKPGDIVHLTVVRGAKTLHLAVKTTTAPNDKTRALIGIIPDQSARIDKLPRKVEIAAGGIGGPSAGLAFTLELMRKLGANVLHGYKVAATGTIRLDGTIGAIGGVKQKVYGVREAGAQVFLVPAEFGNAKEALKYAGPDLKIIPVTTLKQALRALARLPKLP